MPTELLVQTTNFITLTTSTFHEITHTQDNLSFTVYLFVQPWILRFKMYNTFFIMVLHIKSLLNNQWKEYYRGSGIIGRIWKLLMKYNSVNHNTGSLWMEATISLPPPSLPGLPLWFATCVFYFTEMLCCCGCNLFMLIPQGEISNL